jgi:hypothetical protein
MWNTALRNVQFRRRQFLLAVVGTGDKGQIALVPGRDERSDETMRCAGPGEYFGELGPLLRRPRSANCARRHSAVVTGYTPQSFKQLVSHNGRSPGCRTRTRFAATDAVAIGATSATSATPATVGEIRALVGGSLSESRPIGRDGS